MVVQYPQPLARRMYDLKLSVFGWLSVAQGSDGINPDEGTHVLSIIINKYYKES